MQKTLIGILAFYYFYIVAILFFMFTKRKKAVINKEIKLSHFKSYQGETSEELQVVQNHFNNQFQIPVLFFIACLTNLQQNSVTNATNIVAILFVISRVAHSFIHLGSNHVMRRAATYFIGVILVGLMFLFALY